MTGVIAAAAGAALALFGVALGNGIAALFWPRLAVCTLMLGGTAGGLAALGVAIAPASIAERVRRHATLLLSLAWVAAVAMVPALRVQAARRLPGPGLEMLSFEPLFLALVMFPFVVTAAVLISWSRAWDHRRMGWWLVGTGAGCLVAAALAGSSLPLRTPWFGGHELEFTPDSDGVFSLGMDRRLREDLIAPSSFPRVAFVPQPDENGHVETLIVGLRNGPLLAALLEEPNVRLTILEEDSSLVSEVLRRWPALDAARAEGRVMFRGGNPRWSLERSDDRYGYIVLSEVWSYGAYLSRALNLRADHAWTVEAFRSYLDHLRPDGVLFVQRNGIGRVVTTLREATAPATTAFSSNIAVFGGRERLISQLGYRPAGLVDADSIQEIWRHANRSGMEVFYRPSERKINTIYEPLIEGERVRGMYFSTPLDLSPPVDARPFFDNVERMVLSPSGRSMPEELEPMETGAPRRVIPSGDRNAWGTLAGGILAAAAVIAVGLRNARRRASAVPRGVLPTAFFLGSCTALALVAFGAWAQWLSPSATVAQVATGAALLATGGGWLSVRRRDGYRANLVLLLTALTVFVIAGYRAAPAVPRLGVWPSALVVVGAGVIVCLALGRAVGSAGRELTSRLPDSGGWFAGIALSAASLSWVGGRLAVTHFGYPVLWALAAVAAFAALRGLRLLPPGPPT